MAHPPFGDRAEEVVAADGFEWGFGIAGVDTDQFEEASRPGHGGVDGVPGDDQGATRSQHARELRQRPLAVDQVQCLRNHDGVDGTRAQRQCLGHRSDRDGFRQAES